MESFEIEIGTDSGDGGSIVTGRNGTHHLAAIRIERSPTFGSMLIEGIGRSGKTLNAGFYLTPHDTDNLLKGLKDAGIII